MTAATATLWSPALANAASDFFPAKCVIASKPTNCNVNSFGVKKSPRNDFEIYYPGGIVGIRFSAGASEGSTAYVNNVAGTIQLSHGGEASSAMTIITRDGKIYSFTYGE